MNDRSILPVTETRASYVRYGVLAWVCALSMITYIDRVCIKQVQGEMQSELGLTPGQFAWVFSAFALSYSLLEVPSGWLGDKMGPRLVLARIVIWWSVFTALTGCIWQFSLDSGYALYGFGYEIPLLFNSFMLLLLVRFLFGAGEAGAYPNIARALRNWFPYRQRGFAQGLLWMSGRWGGALAPLLIILCSIPFGWRQAFLVFGALGVIWVIGFFRWFRDTPQEHPRVNDAELMLITGDRGRATGPTAPLSWSSMLRSPTLWLLCGMYFCSNSGWSFFITWDVAYYKKNHDLSGTTLAIAAGAPLFFGGLACILGGFLTDRQVRLWGRRWGRTLQGMMAYLLGGIFFFLASQSSSALPAAVFLCLASFLKDFAMAVSWSTCIDIGHRYSGTLSGFMNMVGNFGTVVTPPLVYWLASPTGEAKDVDWNVALYYSTVMFFIAAVCWAFINPRKVIVYTPSDHQRLRQEGGLE
jgi:MFS family permease